MNSKTHVFVYRADEGKQSPSQPERHAVVSVRQETVAKPFYRETTKYYADVLDGQMQTGKSALGPVWADTGALVHPDSYLNRAGVPCLCESFTEADPHCCFHGVAGWQMSLVCDPTPEQMLPDHRRDEHRQRNTRGLKEAFEDMETVPWPFRDAIDTENWGQ